MLILGSWGGKNDRRRVPADGAMATVRPRPHLSLRLIQLRKLLRHGRVVPGQALDGQVLGLVVGKTQIVFRGKQGFFGLLQMVDSLVDFLDGFLEFLAGKPVIAGKLILKVVEVLLKMGDVQVLFPDLGQLGPVLERVEGSVAQHGDDRDEKLWPHHIHL